MANATPSVRADGQIVKIVDLRSIMMLPKQDELACEEGCEAGAWVSRNIRRREEFISTTFVCRVRVDRTRAPQDMIDATNRMLYYDSSLFQFIPRKGPDEAEVYFFGLSSFYWIGIEKIMREYALRGLKPADPYSLAAVNEAVPEFGDDHPNQTCWRVAWGKYYSILFSTVSGERRVHVLRFDKEWLGEAWFAGVRK